MKLDKSNDKCKEIGEILQENIYLETFSFPKLIIYLAKLIYLKVFFCYML